MEQFSKQYEEFIINVYKEVAEAHLNNFVICPLSLHAVLGYVCFCSKGTTARQIAEALHLTCNREQLAIMFQNRIGFLMRPSSYILKNASAFCLKPKFQVKDSYKQIAIKFFGTEVYNIKFKGKRKAVTYINNWICDKTRKRMKRILYEIDIYDHICAMLTNAVCFQGRWRLQFEKKNTKKRRFFLKNYKQVETKMMEATDYFNYSVNKKLQAIFLEIPYEANDITMTFVLPIAIDGLEALEDHIEDILAQKHRFQRVYVAIPKFKIETSMEFKPMLEKMGIYKIFHKEADLSRMHDYRKSLYIDSVIQKAQFAIEETGKILSASTTKFLVDKEVFKDYETFVADHPFLYFIKGPTEVLFIGRYCIPTVFKCI